MRLISNKTASILLPVFIILISGCSQSYNPDVIKIKGELKQWHKVTLLIEGSEMIESPSTFRDYRLDVTFTHNDQSFTIPGHFAADANAAISGAEKGKFWRVYFTPNQTGEWKYSLSFRQGKDVAVGLNSNAGKPVELFDGITGSFTIAPSDKAPEDFRKKGRLQYVGEHYQKFAGDGTYWLAIGTGSPETLLGGPDFDTGVGEQWINDHIQDWRSGDPIWRDGKGKGVIGAVNYMVSQKMNTLWVSFMNAYCDGVKTSTEAYPWPTKEMNISNLSTFDVSKLDQWEIVVEHAQNNGMALHVIFSEEEIEGIWEKVEGLAVGGELSFADTRKLYYREIVSRFGYLNALDWNMGEELGLDDGITNTLPTGGWPPVSDGQKKLFIDYVTALDVYQHSRGWEGRPNEPMLDYAQWFTGTEFNRANIQGTTTDANEYAVSLRLASEAAGHPWVINFSEHHRPALSVRRMTSEYLPIFRESPWGSFLGGGAGVEWYLESDDAFLISLRPYKEVLTWTAYARDFMNRYLPFWEMKPDNTLLRHRAHNAPGISGYCFAKKGEIYAIYLRNAEKAMLNLANVKGVFEVSWFDPRNGGSLQSGTVEKVNGGSIENLGQPLSSINEDWVVLVRKVQ